MRQLLLMRHGKSDWDADYEGDHQRPLNPRGVRSARLMGRLLSSKGLAPARVISSTAVRARTTAELAAEAGEWTAEIVLERDLYDLGPAGVVASAAGSPEVQPLMLVGHQPTWGLLVSVLTGAKADMKTASVAVVEMPIESWAELPAATGVLAGLHHPRTYFGSRWDEP